MFQPVASLSSYDNASFVQTVRGTGGLADEGQPFVHALPTAGDWSMFCCSAGRADGRRELVEAYRRRVLATTTAEEFLFPGAHATVVKRVLGALIVFFEGL
ncbi:hypothetical protein MRX96_042533 [Rhipicephalus microplus]